MDPPQCLLAHTGASAPWPHGTCVPKPERAVMRQCVRLADCGHAVAMTRRFFESKTSSHGAASCGRPSRRHRRRRRLVFSCRLIGRMDRLDVWPLPCLAHRATLSLMNDSAANRLLEREAPPRGIDFLQRCDPLSSCRVESKSSTYLHTHIHGPQPTSAVLVLLVCSADPGHAVHSFRHR